MKPIMLVAIVLLLVACSPCATDSRWDPNNEDLYCYDASNVSNMKIWTVGRHSDDAKRIAAREEASRIAAEKQQCYDAGEDTYVEFDIIADYNLSCGKIEYINDHLLDNYEARNGGYIKDSYRGLFSRHATEVQLITYVNQRVLATGLLVRNMTYHTDCNGIVTVKEDHAFDLGRSSCSWTNDEHDGDCYIPRVSYYTEADFVMYYVDRCIQ